MNRFSVLLLFFSSAFLAGCPASGDDVAPPTNEFRFPTDLVASSDGRVLFVSNANSDLRFDSGVVSALSLELVESTLDAWKASGEVPQSNSCIADADDPRILVCEESGFMLPEAAARIGNFATSIAIQPNVNGGDRLFAAVRGDPSVTWLDYDPAAQKLSCREDDSFRICDDDHRLDRLRRTESENIEIFDEPFQVYADPADGYVMVSHLSSGTVTMLEAPVDGGEPFVADVETNLFSGNTAVGVGGSALDGRLPGQNGNLVYIASRTDGAISTFSVAEIAGQKRLVRAGSFDLNLGASTATSSARGIAFRGDGNRAYVAHRAPPTLRVIDTSLDDDGIPRNQFLHAIEICQNATDVIAAEIGGETRIAVSCFSENEVWVVDPETPFALPSVANVGAGPQSVVLSPRGTEVYVGNVLSNSIAVVDMTPAVPGENRVRLILGFGETE